MTSISVRPNLFYVLMLSIILTAVEPAQAALPCRSFFVKDNPSATLQKLVPDLRLRQVPLHPTSHGIMGYEFMRSKPVFSRPNSFRLYINKNPTPRRSAFETEFLGPSRGHITFYAQFDGPERILTNRKILNELSKNVPLPFSNELSAYVQSVLADAKKRGLRIARFDMTIRTEEYPSGFPAGHNHGGGGTLDYSKAEIGLNTDIDMLNRFAPEVIRDEDYTSSFDNRTVAVFGDVWHRTPPRANEQPRLYILISLTPLD